MEPDLIVCSGQIIALRLFDIAYAIDLAKAETLCGRPVAPRPAPEHAY